MSRCVGVTSRAVGFSFPLHRQQGFDAGSPLFSSIRCKWAEQTEAVISGTSVNERWKKLEASEYASHNRACDAELERDTLRQELATANRANETLREQLQPRKESENMNYLLTEAEYADINRKHAEVIGAPRNAIAAMREMIVGKKCVAKHRGRRVYDGSVFSYCDECPLSYIGGDRKGEIRPTMELSRIMCDLSREYSK